MQAKHGAHFLSAAQLELAQSAPLLDPAKHLLDNIYAFTFSSGKVVVVGTPEMAAEHPTSHTGSYLKQVLEQHPPEAVEV